MKLPLLSLSRLLDVTDVVPDVVPWTHVQQTEPPPPRCRRRPGLLGAGRGRRRRVASGCRHQLVDGLADQQEHSAGMVRVVDAVDVA